MKTVMSVTVQIEHSAHNVKFITFKRKKINVQGVMINVIHVRISMIIV